MYESQTYEVILNRLLDACPTNVDKREGSIIYDALAPAAIELAKTYVAIDQFLIDSFADTATRPYLILRAAERGISPTQATCAELKAKFTPADIEIPAGSRFFVDTLYFKSAELIERDDNYAYYRVVAEKAGTTGNAAFGTLVPADNITGLKTSETVELLKAGVNEEETEHFRNRYFDNIKASAFGGNIADYKEKVGALDGVGALKVYPCYAGGGTVKIVVANTDYAALPQGNVDDIQEAVMPLEYPAQGKGIAPIGHDVLVQSVGEKAIETHCVMTLTQLGYDTYHASYHQVVWDAVAAYYKELRETWSDTTTGITISVAQIISHILQNCSEVLDIEYSTFRIGSAVAPAGENLVLDLDVVPTFGVFAVQTKLNN